MRKLIWKIRYVYYMCAYIGFKPSDIAFGWYNATVWADELEWYDAHPKDAVLEEMSCWDPE